jgi:hypothetical protein
VKQRISSLIVLGYAAFFMLIAVTSCFVTIANGSYRGLLLWALSFMLLADLLCLIVIRRRQPAGIALAVAIMIPSLFVISEFIRRSNS